MSRTWVLHHPGLSSGISPFFFLSPLLELVEGVAQPQRAQHDEETEHSCGLARVHGIGAACRGQLRRAGQEAAVEGGVEAAVVAGTGVRQAGQRQSPFRVVGVPVVVFPENCGQTSGLSWLGSRMWGRELGSAGAQGRVRLPGSGGLWPLLPAGTSPSPPSSLPHLIPRGTWPNICPVLVPDGQPCLHPPPAQNPPV